MACHVVWSPTATLDLKELRDYIAEDNPDAAVAFVNAIFERNPDRSRLARRKRNTGALKSALARDQNSQRSRSLPGLDFPRPGG